MERMSDKKGRGMFLALMAGLMAASGSVCAKLAMSADVVNGICRDLVQTHVGATQTADNEDDVHTHVLCDSISIGLRLLCFGSIFLFNVLMWTFYTKSLQFCTSTVEATVTNTASNFLFTAVMGYCLFGERFTVLWGLGSCLILAGLVLIHKGNHESQDAAERKQR